MKIKALSLEFSSFILFIIKFLLEILFSGFNQTQNNSNFEWKIVIIRCLWMKTSIIRSWNSIWEVNLRKEKNGFQSANQKDNKTWKEDKNQNRNQQSECAPSEYSDQHGQPPSLIRVFALRLVGSWGPELSLCGQRRLWSDWTDAHADLSLRWAHSQFVSFFMSRFIWLLRYDDLFVWFDSYHWTFLSNKDCHIIILPQRSKSGEITTANTI